MASNVAQITTSVSTTDRLTGLAGDSNPTAGRPGSLPFSAEALVDGPLATSSWAAARYRDYLLIIKPRISMMVMLTVTVGYWFGHGSLSTPSLLIPSLIGIALVAVGSSAFNQWYERRTDGQMQRTAGRPLPMRRLPAAEVLTFGFLCSAIGLGWLAIATPPWTSALSALTLVLYAAVYTPLKRVSWWCVAVGAVPGALPPVLGFVAGGGESWIVAGSLFAILFFWQFPHFMAIAWKYQADYLRAGLVMLPGRGRPSRYQTGNVACVTAVLLLLVSLVPWVTGFAGPVYAIAALAAGLLYLGASIRFRQDESLATARRLLLTSLVYLPVILGALVANGRGV